MFAPSVDTRVDWFRLLAQLKREGYSLYSVSHFTEITRMKLVGYKQGAEPKYHDGKRLLEFWVQVMSSKENPPTIDDAPRISPYSYKA